MFTPEQAKLQKSIFMATYKYVSDLEKSMPNLALMPRDERIRLYVSGIMQALANLLYDEGYCLTDDQRKQWMKTCIDQCFEHVWHYERMRSPESQRH